MAEVTTETRINAVARRVLRIVLCLAAAFVPFLLGALLLGHGLRIYQQPDIGAMVASFAFFLNSAAFVWLAVTKDA